jgi:8-oxo-dGTP diphosphatase
MLEKHKSEKEFLKTYNPNNFARPNVSVDASIFTIIDEEVHVLLIKRENHPFKDFWSLVGGYVDIEQDYDIETTAKRKLKEKTGVDTPYLEQLGAFGNNNRDPRFWSVTISYFALIPHNNIKINTGSGAIDIKWSKVKKGKVKDELAFDHKLILEKASERLRKKVLYTSLPVFLMPQYFTLRELQSVYETILNKKIDSKSFRRRIINADIIEEIGTFSQPSEGRPAKLYRKSEVDKAHFFLRNIEGASL